MTLLMHKMHSFWGASVCHRLVTQIRLTNEAVGFSYAVAPYSLAIPKLLAAISADNSVSCVYFLQMTVMMMQMTMMIGAMMIRLFLFSYPNSVFTLPISLSWQTHSGIELERCFTTYYCTVVTFHPPHYSAAKNGVCTDDPPSHFSCVFQRLRETG